MANDAINEMISAFALGCMDKENFKQFRNYIENDGEMPRKELGEFQNIISLIPVILDITPPREDLKNELGKRLIEIQKNIRDNVVENRRETRIDAKEKFLERSSSTKIFDVNEKREDFSRQSKIENNPTPPREKTRTNVTVMDNAFVPPATGQGTSSINSILLWVFSSILLIAIVLLSYFFNSKTTDFTNQLTSLKSQIVKLRADLSKTNSFVTENKEFVEFFNNPNINIIPLKGLEPTSKENGRLFISFDVAEGLLQMNNMPHLEPDKVYQLWLVSRGGTFSLGTFEIKPDKKYMEISEIPFVMKEDIQLFRITKEARGGAEIPSGETILFGTLQKDTSKKKRRR